MANVTTIYAGTDSGLAILNKPGTLPEWLPPRMTLGGQRVSSCWSDPGPPVRVAAVAGGQLLWSENGGRSWEAAEVGSPVSSLLYAVQQATLYAAGHSRVWRSTGHGASWEELPPLPESGPCLLLAADGKEQTRLYLAAGKGALYAGDPQAGDWQPLPLGGVISLSQDPGTGQLYAAVAEGLSSSSDAGASWQPLEGAPQGGKALLVLPGPAGKPPAIIVGTRYGLQVSPDGGQSWHSPDLPSQQEAGVTSLARDPERRDRLYAATSTGYLFESGNRGQSWQPVNENPLPPVLSLFVVRI